MYSIFTFLQPIFSYTHICNVTVYFNVILKCLCVWVCESVCLCECVCINSITEMITQLNEFFELFNKQRSAQPWRPEWPLTSEQTERERFINTTQKYSKPVTRNISAFSTISQNPVCLCVCAALRSRVFFPSTFHFRHIIIFHTISAFHHHHYYYYFKPKFC